MFFLSNICDDTKAESSGDFFYAMPAPIISGALLLLFCCFITGAVRRRLKTQAAAKIMQFVLHVAPLRLPTAEKKRTEKGGEFIRIYR
jgi:hypothetical protein